MLFTQAQKSHSALIHATAFAWPRRATKAELGVSHRKQPFHDEQDPSSSHPPRRPPRNLRICMDKARGRPRQDDNRILCILVSLHRSSIASTVGRPPHAIPSSVFFTRDPCDISLFYISRQWYDRDSLAKPSNLDHSKVTRYNFAFFQINEKGDIWGTDSWADSIVLLGDSDWNPAEGAVQYCSWDAPGEPPACGARQYETGLISQAHSAGVEVYPSIGGWTLSGNFPKLAASATSRVDFANNCVKLIEAYDFDGIDIE